MTIEQYAALVADMRHAQKNYFRLRSPAALEHSKKLEKEVDEATKQILRPDQQKKMF